MMRKWLYLFVLLFVSVVLLTGCTTADVQSLEQLLADVGVTVDIEQALQTAGVEIPDIGQMIQTGADDFLRQIRGFRLEIPNAVRLALVAVGLALAFAGGRLYRVAVAAPGFTLGFVIGYAALNLAEELPDLVVIGVAFVIGAVGAGLALAVHDTALVVIGAVTGGFLIVSLLIAYAVQFSVVFVVIVLVCAVAGGLGLALVGRSMQFMLGALMGAVLVSLGLVENLSLFIIVPLALLGVGAQLGLKYWREREPHRAPVQPGPAAPVEKPPPSPRQAPRPVEAGAVFPAYEGPASPEPGFPAYGEQPVKSATLTYWSGAGLATVYIDRDEFSIGSDVLNCSLVLDGLAPVHALILSGMKDGANCYYLQSQVDPTDVLVNGRLARATYLKDGDVLRLGGYELRFRTLKEDRFG
ncbi:MAG: DUF4203 domain-containing protein [Anaerolineae bacterium]|nr:DUF4203 domain-containing protein [Anaerolineae bacterium]